MMLALTADRREADAVETGDARLWRPEDALRAVLRDIEAGVVDPDMIYIGMRVPSEGGYTYTYAGGSHGELVVLLTRHVQKLCGSEQ